MNDHANENENNAAFKRPDTPNIRRVDTAALEEAMKNSTMEPENEPHIRPSYLNYIYDVPEEERYPGIKPKRVNAEAPDFSKKAVRNAQGESEAAAEALTEVEVKEVPVIVEPKEAPTVTKTRTKRPAKAQEDEEVLPAREDIYADTDGTSIVIEILDWIKYILLAIIIGLLLSYFVIQRSAVQGTSMSPTLLNNDQLLVEKVSVRFAQPQKGAIITIDGTYLENYNSNEMLVKRVVAGPGDRLDFKDGKVYINGELLEEKYLPEGIVTSAPQDWKGEMTIPENYLYVLGDNRAFSADSRMFGPVPMKAVVGHVLIRIYPFSRIGTP